jgi:hypothetical protein
MAIMGSSPSRAALPAAIGGQESRAQALPFKARRMDWREKRTAFVPFGHRQIRPPSCLFAALSGMIVRFPDENAKAIRGVPPAAWCSACSGWAPLPIRPNPV